MFKELKSEDLIKFLDLFKAVGVIITAKESCRIKTNIEIIKNKFITFIFFKPMLHKIISSFCLLNFNIESIKASKKDKGMNLVRIFVTFKKE